MKNQHWLIGLFLLISSTLIGQSIEPIEITDQWLSKIESLAPSAPRVKTDTKKILVFSQHTGFYHWTIPHNAEMLKILAKKSGAFEVTVAYDVDSFDKKNLQQYDAVILNNSNPSGPKRDLFWDLLKKNTSLSDATIAKRAAQYQQNLMSYVSKGGGLLILHGAITVQNNSSEFSKMVGGSFDYHPKQQQMHLKEVDANHPLVQAFDGKGFTHVDEPYFFNNAYFDYNFRPLLYIEADQLEDVRKAVSNNIIYVSWIKRHGKGRVFYSSASHNAQSLENPQFLQFLLDGMQYVVGDLKCDDSPIGVQ
ncbi:ThuA domain-containing protein [Arenibacter sp. 6A1]|uniref:ThuA domain-containing protein n=1 Tax=Arenibacter sp. 6A1 TaxID=2720391 RepID=UPI001445C1EF|nr:ThuA domain-containing protein [Arenibacter sp. 6A1]NKI25333.1 ThuA domain-containing protein [Arenibacter sp. 6A1]